MSFIGILVALASIILFIKGLLATTVLAVVISYLISPVVDFLERSGLSRTLSTVVPFILSGVIVAVSFALLVPLVVDQSQSLIEHLPQYQQDLATQIILFEQKLNGYLHLERLNISQELSDWMVDRTGEFSAALPAVLSRSFTIVLLAPFFAFFILKDGNRLTRALFNFVPNQLFEIALNLRHQINYQLGSFIRARFIEAAIVGIIIWIGLKILGFPFATVLALFAALMNLIPYVGPIVGAAPPILIALVSQSASGGNPQMTIFLVSSLYLLAQLIDVIFVIPLLVAKIVDLHPVTVIVMIIVGAELGGVLGMMISVPVTSAAKLTLNTVYLHLTNFRD